MKIYSKRKQQYPFCDELYTEIEKREKYKNIM